MLLFTQIIAIVAGLALGTTLMGRAMVAVCRIHLLARSSVENFIISGWLGTACWILIFGVCSYLGMTARPAALVVFGVGVSLLIATTVTGRLGWLVPGRLARPFLPVGAACTCAALGYLMPLAVGNCYNFANDAMHYIQNSEWLQDHGVGETIPYDLEQPVACGIVGYQIYGHRIGPQFLLALLQTAFGGHFLAVELFPVAMVWGLVLNIGAIYVLCRWAFRMERSYAMLAAWLAAVTTNPLTWSADDGYFCQIYATAGMSVAGAVFSRLLRPSFWRLGNAWLPAFLGAYILSVYSEMAPVMAITAASFCLICWFRGAGTHRMRFLAFAGGTLVLMAIVGNVEFLRAYRMLTTQGGRIGPCPGWSDLECITFLLGLRTFNMPMDAKVYILLGLTTVLVIGGWLRSIASPRTLPLTVITVTYACLYVAFHPGLRGRPGETFADFKISQWAFPLVPVLEIAAVQWLLRHLVRHRPILRWAVTMAVCLSLLVLAAPGRRRECLEVVERMHFLMASKKPFKELRELRRKLDERGIRKVLVFNPSGALVPGGFAPFMFYPRSFYHLHSPWWPACDPGDIDLPVTLPDDVIILMMGLPAFEPTGDRWPCGLWRIEPSTPVVQRFMGRNGLERWPPGDMFYWLDTEPARLEILASADGPVRLSFTAVPGPSMPATIPRHLRVNGPAGQVRDVLVEGTSPVSVPLHLSAGKNHVEFRCLDLPTIPPVPGGDPRTLLLGIQRLRIDVQKSGD